MKLNKILVGSAIVAFSISSVCFNCISNEDVSAYVGGSSDWVNIPFEGTKKIDEYLYTQTVLNVRAKPSVNSKKIGCLDSSTKVHATGVDGNWYRIDFRGGSAWVCGDYLSDEMPLIKLSSTAYWEKDSSHSASGRNLVKGVSIAGKVAWLNRECYIYECDADGSVGDYIGKYSFDDTGYGASTGYGSSKILEGRSIGTIENGTCIDIYMNNESQCYDYGRRDVYIQFVD